MTEPSHSANKSLMVIDDPAAPEVFVSGVLGAAPEPGGLVKVTFATLRHDPANPSRPASQVVNLRLVMSLGALGNMVNYLEGLVKSMAAANAPPPSGTPIQ